ncbi:hypothetical protein D3C86_1983840 [compost metagenome]
MPLAKASSGAARDSWRPSITMLPVQGSTRDSARNRVVLPAPLLPTSATISARDTSSDTSRSTGNSP